MALARTLWALILCLILCLSAGMAGAESISVHDFRNKEITLAQPARRIVCLLRSALSGLCMLGVQDKVTAVSRDVYQAEAYGYYRHLDPRLAGRTLPAPGNWDFVNIESVVALQPDLVIIWAHQSEAIAALEARGLRVYGVFIKKLTDVYKQMEDLGRLTGSGGRAARLLAYTKAGINGFSGKVAALRQKQPRVYFMWAQGPLETSGAGSTVDELITLAGGKNVAGGIDREHLVVNQEKLLAWDPQVVVMWPNPRLSPASLGRHSPWRTINAVRSGRVHQLPDAFSCSLWTLNFQYAALLTAKWCHPRALAGLDQAAERRELLKTLYGPAILPALEQAGAE